MATAYDAKKDQAQPTDAPKQLAGSDDDARPKVPAAIKPPAPPPLVKAVATAEALVAQLGAGVLERSTTPTVDLAPMIKPLHAELARALAWARAEAHDTAVVAAVEYTTRLEIAMKTISAIARRHTVNLTGAGLAEAFDLEDALFDALKLEQPKLANKYYYEKFTEAPVVKSDEKSITDHVMTHGNEADASSARDTDELVAMIMARAHIFGQALHDAAGQVEEIIKQPDVKPEHEDMLLALAAALTNIALGQIAKSVGELVSHALDVGDGAPSFSHVVHQGIVDASKEVVRKSPGLAQKMAPPETQPHDAKPHDKSAKPPDKNHFAIWLQGRTTKAASNVDVRVAQTEAPLKRTPAPILKRLFAAFTDDSLRAQVTATARTKMLQEWVNYVAQASSLSDKNAAFGVDANTGASLKEPSALESVDTVRSSDGDALRLGTLHVRFSVRGGHPHFERADLSGVSGPVKDGLRAGGGSLAKLGINRLVDFYDANSANVGIGVGGRFLVDAHHALVPQDSSPESRRAFAALAHNASGNPDVDALTGMAILVGALDTIDCARIS